MTSGVVQLHTGDDVGRVADQAAATVGCYLDRCKLAANTVKAYRRQCAAYVAWITRNATKHPDAFADVVGAAEQAEIVATVFEQ